MINILGKMIFLVQKLKKAVELCGNSNRSLSISESTKVFYSAKCQSMLLLFSKFKEYSIISIIQ